MLEGMNSLPGCARMEREESHTGSLKKNRACEIEWFNGSIIEPKKTKVTNQIDLGLNTASDHVSAQTFLPSDGCPFL